MKKNTFNLFILSFLMLLFISSFASAYELHKKDTNYSYQETVANSESCDLTKITYPNGSISNLNISMSNDGFNFYSDILSGNFSQSGDVCWGIVCYDSDADPQYVSSRKCLTVTSSGDNPSTANAIGNTLIILFLLSLIFLTSVVSKKTNYEKWHKSLLKKYENRNYVKLVLGSIGYNLVKHSFLIYYLIGFPIILSITNISYIFGIDFMINIMTIILFIYTMGSIIVGIYLFSHVQEWIMDLLNEISNMNWGVSR